ncbi:hypothetical protein [Kutzneria sp. CA-103260]|uniref:hypothetical protein n=1 Tax=Kutzneria sp. CA-103260 TaxID=2802641 RepID=UPI001BA7F984|nr:hypothetical protein [Kutzneria sp. CA-103260]QUQ63783.1 hypothetical protein JJ691_14960 [Kutzneria sp. CA-103260]
MSDMHIEPEEFGERYLSEGAAIDFDGVTVRLRHVVPAVAGGSRLVVEFEDYVDEPVQAVCCATSKGMFEVDGEKSRRLVFWADNSPRVVTATLTNRVPAEVVLWNAWRRGADGIDAGLRYAGMTVTELGERHWRFRCSDGIGGPDFDDLVFTARIVGV